MEEDSFNATPAQTYWDRDVGLQHEALAACRRAGDRMGEARARNALGLLGLRRGYHSSAHIEFQQSLWILKDLGDTRHTPVVRMHIAECMIGVGLCREATEILTESLAVFRDRGDNASEAKALCLLDAIQEALQRWTLRPGLDDPASTARRY